MDYKKLTTEDIQSLRGMISDPDRFITEVTQHWDHDQFKTVRAMPDLVIQPVTAEEVASVLKYASDHNIPSYSSGEFNWPHGCQLDGTWRNLSGHGEDEQGR